MKVRKEISGVHIFKRDTGLHILLDEIELPQEEICNSPRTFSIALTNVCDLKCPFCYAPKSKHSLDFEYLKNVILEAEKLQVLEITLGGGEPLLYPNIIELIDWIHSRTTLGVSLTTHGHHLNKKLINQIKGKLSKLRISIDDIEPRYSLIRGRPLLELEKKILEFVSNNISFGINIVVNQDYITNLPKTIEYIISLGAEDILLIPEHVNGIVKYKKKQWNLLNDIMEKYQNRIQLNVTSTTMKEIAIKTIVTAKNNEFMFAHLSADKKIKFNSYTTEGLLLLNPEELKNRFITLNN